LLFIFEGVRHLKGLPCHNLTAVVTPSDSLVNHDIFHESNTDGHGARRWIGRWWSSGMAFIGVYLCESVFVFSSTKFVRKPRYLY
ncbi:hypothetical protein, partial [Fischerella muscicola]